MSKDLLVNDVAEQAGMTKVNALKVIEAIFGTIQESLGNEEPVNVAGFGSFKVSKRKARTGRNPKTGDPISIPESKVPSFSAAKALKEAINGKPLDS